MLNGENPSQYHKIHQMISSALSAVFRFIVFSVDKQTLPERNIPSVQWVSYIK